MTYTRPAAVRTVRATVAVLRALLAVAWVVGTVWLSFAAFVAGATFLGEQPSPADASLSAKYLAAAAAVAVGVPVVGLVLAAFADAEGAGIRWLIGCVVGLVAAGFLLAWRHEELPDNVPPPRPAPTRTHCQEFSGPPTTCPGG